MNSQLTERLQCILFGACAPCFRETSQFADFVLIVKLVCSTVSPAQKEITSASKYAVSKKLYKVSRKEWVHLLYATQASFSYIENLNYIKLIGSRIGK